MGRLIDEDVLMADVRNTITEESGAIDWINLINRQPTAYDPDKVVEQLEEAEHNARTMIGFEKAYGSVDDRIKAEAEAKAFKRTIEIVKGGGADA